MAKKRKVNEFRQERVDFAKSHAIAEREILPFIRKALKQTVAPVIFHAKTYGLDNLMPEALINKDVWSQVYPKIFNKLGMKFARAEYYRQRNLDRAIETKASAIDFLIDVWTSQLRDYALRYTYQISRELNETTLKIIREALGSEYLLGLDGDAKIRLFIKDITGKFKLRAGNISRTESTTIANLGKDIGARGWIEEAGGGGYKAWLGRNDKKERHTHLEENNTILPIDDFHIVGGEQCQRPGDVSLSAKERIGCRCTETYMSNTRYQAYKKRGRIIGGKLIGAS